MDGITLGYAEKLMCLAMRDHNISWESPLEPHDYERTKRENFDTDMAIVAIGLAKGFWTWWLKTSEMQMLSIVDTIGYEMFIRQFLRHYFRLNYETYDMVSVLTMIMYILETSVQLYSRNETDAPVVGVRVLAEVLRGDAQNRVEMEERVIRLHATAFQMMADPKYCNFEILQGES